MLGLGFVGAFGVHAEPDALISPNGHVRAWRPASQDGLSNSIMVAQSGQVRRLRCEPFIRDFWFVGAGNMIAIDCGGAHFAGREQLFATTSLRKLAEFDQAAVPLSLRPAWSSRDLKLVPVHVARGCEVDRSAPVTTGGIQSSTICLMGRDGNPVVWRLSFLARRGEVRLSWRGKPIVLEKFDPRFNPELVGSEQRIRFLPPRLQPYGDQGLVLFLSSRRSSGGQGGGQCGAGSEDHLNVLDVKRDRPQVVARFQIGSCLDGVELSDTQRYGDLRSFRVEGGQLYIDFLIYRDNPPDRLRAALASDALDWQFMATPANPD